MLRVGNRLGRVWSAIRSGSRSRCLPRSEEGRPALFGRRGGSAGRRVARFEPLESRLLLSITPLDWTPQGPSSLADGQVEGMTSQGNPVIGALHTVLADPGDPGVIYAGSVNGGIWKTGNATAADPTWIPLTDFEDSLSIGAMEFDPTDTSHQTIVAGIGRFSSLARSGGVDTGVLRTTDGGAHWDALGQIDLLGLNISGVAARGATMTVSGNDFRDGGGLYHSTDDGAFWDLISGAGGEGDGLDNDADGAIDQPGEINLPFGDVGDLVGDPGNPDRLYASLLPTVDATFGIITQPGGIYRSDDMGATWALLPDPALSAAINATPQANSNGIFSGTNNTEMTVHYNADAGTNVLYVGNIFRGQINGLFRYDVSGDAWSAMDIPLTNEGAQTFDLQPRVKPGGQGAIHFSILADPNDENIVYVGGDRQPEYNESPTTNGTWPNSVGAFDFSGRLFRGDATAAGGSQWTPLTHVGAVPAATELHDVEGATRGSPIAITAPGHDLAANDLVYVFGVEGNTAANGLWVVTVPDNDHFRLWAVDATTASDGSGSGTYANGTGQWYRYQEAGADEYLGSAPHADSREMVFDAAGRLVEVDDGGIYRRANPTSLFGSWTSLNGNLQTTELHSVDWDANTGTIIGGAQDVGTPQQSSPGSNAWSEVDKADGGQVAVDDVTTPGQSVRYSSIQNLGFFIRETFNTAGERIASDEIDLIVQGTGVDLHGIVGAAVQFRQPYELNAVDPRKLVIGTDYLLESDNRGATLTATGGVINLNNNGADDDGDGTADDGFEWSLANPLGRISSLAYGGFRGSTPKKDVLYVSTVAGDVLVRTAGSGMPTVTSFSTANGGGFAVDLVLDPDDWRHAFVIGVSRVFETTNAGGAWNEVTGNLNTLQSFNVSTFLRSVAYVNGAEHELVIVGGRDGVFAMDVSNPGTWADVRGDMPHVLIRDLAVHSDGSDHLLLAGTQGRGAWTIDGADELLSVRGRSGDLIGMDLGRLLHGSDFSLTGAEVAGIGASLTIATEAGTGDLLLQDGGGGTIARLIHCERAESSGETFADVGRLYVAPLGGFTGGLELTFDFKDDGAATRQFVLPVVIEPGHTGSEEEAITINSETLDVLRLQHRLNYLGYRGDAVGNPLEMTGIMDAETITALKLFQAVVDPQGEGTPNGSSGQIGLNSAEWLNEENAPYWDKYAPLGAAAERHGTDWLTYILTEVYRAGGPYEVPGLAAAGINVSTISTVDGVGCTPAAPGGSTRPAWRSISPCRPPRKPAATTRSTPASSCCTTWSWR